MAPYGTYGTSDTFAIYERESSWALKRRWRPFQLAALALVLLSRRDDEPDERLWYFPSSQFEELQTLAPPGSEEAKYKASPMSGTAFRRFGNASVTVSWKSLVAIESAIGLRPVDAREVIRDLSGFQSPAGLYGSKRRRKDGVVSINENARHTAMSLLVQMHFGEDRAPTSIYARFRRQIDWLLNEAMLPDGGWPFEQTEESKKEGLGATSTTACLMAISQFEKLCRLRESDQRVLPSNLCENVTRSVKALLDARADGIWDLRNEGLPLETRVAESAYIISGIRHAMKFGALSSLVDERLDMRAVLRALQSDLLSLAMPFGRGWPANIGGLSISSAATICALHAISGIEPSELNPAERELISNSENHVITSLTRDNGWELLRTWDWATLAEYASVKIGPLSSKEWSSFAKKIGSVRRAHMSGRLTPYVLYKVPSVSRSAVVYCLTRGRGLTAHHAIRPRVVSSFLEFAGKSFWVSWAAGISFVTGLILARLLR
jgi:hypothetical protein